MPLLCGRLKHSMIEHKRSCHEQPSWITADLVSGRQNTENPLPAAGSGLVEFSVLCRMLRGSWHRQLANIGGRLPIIAESKKVVNVYFQDLRQYDEFQVRAGPLVVPELR